MEYTLNADHLHNLVAERGLNAEWVKVNCTSIDAKRATELLGYEAKSGGIWLMGYGYQGQFKPNKPWKAETDKKAPKYRSQLGSYDAMLPNHPTEKRFWDDMEKLKELCPKIDGKPYLIITEGFFKSIAATSCGYPTIALLGVEMGLTSAKDDPQNKRYLVPLLEKYARADFGFIIGFDADATENDFVKWAERKLHHQLIKFGCPTRSISGTWEIAEGKGIDDYVQKNGATAFSKIIHNSVDFKQWEFFHFAFDKPANSTKIFQAYEKVKEEWGDKLRFNLRSREIEFNGKPFEVDTIKLDVAEKFNVELSREDCTDIITKLAHENEYHPIVEYLENVSKKYGNDTSILEGMARRYFGVSKEIYQIYLVKTLVGAVSRLYQPGCKFDTCLILQGQQGIRKSTFFRYLFGSEFFTESQFGGTEKDELMKLHQYWCIELAEIEAVFSKKESAQLKNFLSTPRDTFREPYGRRTKQFPRQFVLVGSTNSDEFLYDPTGERRYWVIPAKQLIPIDLLEQERDRIWAAAVALFRSGYRVDLNYEEQQLSNQENKEWSSFDPWQDVVSKWLQRENNSYSKAEFIPTSVLLADAVLLPDKDQSAIHARRLKNVMVALNYQPCRQRVNGSNVRGWLKAVPDVPVDPDFSGTSTGTAETRSQQDSQATNAQSCTTEQNFSGTTETRSQQDFKPPCTTEPLKNAKTFSSESSPPTQVGIKKENLPNFSGSVVHQPKSAIVEDGMGGGFTIGQKIVHKRYKELGECQLIEYLGQGQWMVTYSYNGAPGKRQVGAHGMELVQIKAMQDDQPSLFEAVEVVEAEEIDEIIEEDLELEAALELNLKFYDTYKEELEKSKCKEDELRAKIKYLNAIIPSCYPYSPELREEKEQEKAKYEAELHYLVICKPLPNDAPVFCKWVSAKVNPDSLIAYIKQLLNPHFPQFATTSNAQYLVNLINNYCGDNAELKQQVWAGLSEEEKAQFKALLQ